MSASSTGPTPCGAYAPHACRRRWLAPRIACILVTASCSSRRASAGPTRPGPERSPASSAVGYVVNLAAYGVAEHLLAIDYRTAATLAFGLALTTTFALNRRYTFAAEGGAVHRQAWRYALVNALGFATNLVVLQLLVEYGYAPKLTAEALAAVVAAPVNYTGQRLWAFAHRRETVSP